MASTPKDKSAQSRTTARPAKPPALNLPEGTGSTRSKRRIVTLYSPPKNGKTHTVGKLVGCRWMVTDSNCIPTLEQAGLLPPDKAIHEVANMVEAKAVLGQYLDAADANVKAGREPLGFPAFVLDSLTALSDWHQSDVANQTGQTYLGQAKDGGWQQFNAEFGEMLEMLADLGRYVNVILIGHAAPKPDSKRGEYAGFQLSPAMAIRVGRLTNWILYLDRETRPHKDGDQVVEGMDQLVQDVDGQSVLRRCFRTMPYGGYTASAPPNLFGPTEPPDLEAMLRKAGAL